MKNFFLFMCFFVVLISLNCAKLELVSTDDPNAVSRAIVIPGAERVTGQLRIPNSTDYSIAPSASQLLVNSGQNAAFDINLTQQATVSELNVQIKGANDYFKLNVDSTDSLGNSNIQQIVTDFLTARLALKIPIPSNIADGGIYIEIIIVDSLSRIPNKIVIYIVIDNPTDTNTIPTTNTTEITTTIPSTTTTTTSITTTTTTTTLPTTTTTTTTILTTTTTTSTTESTTTTTTTTIYIIGQNWVLINSNASFSARYAHETLSYSNKIYLFGGIGAGALNDVWSTSDGVTWNLEISNAALPARYQFGAQVFNGAMWIIGGKDSIYYNDVWSSTDGVNWQNATTNAGWEARRHPFTYVYNNKLWVIGGEGGVSGITNDVWSSSDGTNWTLETNSTSFPGVVSMYGGAFIISNTMWLIQNQSCWSSSNGIDWNLESTNLAFPQRAYIKSIFFDNRAWLMAGTGYSDVWYSLDGINWIQQTPSAAFGSRESPGLAVLNSSIVLTGGFGSPNNDVWITP